jgi:uncharacterized OsmC-like protein
MNEEDIMEATQTNAAPKKEKKPLNGVDVPTLLATINAVAGQRELAQFKFRATNEWIKGTHSRATMQAFDGAGGTHEQTREFSYDADHPPALCGAGNGPTPVEFLLSALAQCLTAGIGNIAAVRGITLESVKCTVEGDADLSGLLGIDSEVRNGYSAIRVNFEISGDASEEDLRKVVAQSQARSAVFDMLTNGTSVDVSVG